MPSVENLIVLDSFWKDDEQEFGRDWKGHVVMKGDRNLFDPENDVVIPEEDLLDYVIGKLGFQFITAE